MVNGHRLIYWQKKNLLLRLARFTIVIVAIICLLLFSNLSHTKITIMVVVLAFLALYQYLLYLWRVDTVLSKNTTMYLPFTSRIDESGFETRNDKDVNKRKWSDFSGWLENDSYFILLENVGFRVIPKRILSNKNQVDNLRSLFKQYIGNAA